MPDQEQGSTKGDKSSTEQTPPKPPVIELKVKRVMDSDNTIDRSRVLNEKEE